MTNECILEFKNWSVRESSGIYALKDISVTIQPNILVAVTGANQAGKSTFLRSINRLHELTPSIKTSGEILFNGVNMRTLPVAEVRKRVGMVMPGPNIFPKMSIQENVLAGYILTHVSLSKQEKDKIVEEYLREVCLWDDIKNDLHRKPDFLSTGQQQCLCIARALALRPEILLLDESGTSLDLMYANKIDTMLQHLKDRITILIATRNLAKAVQLADYTLYLEAGELIEHELTSQLFLEPKDKRTERYLTDRS